MVEPVWELLGTDQQETIVSGALSKCDFPFERMAESLKREGKTSIRVEWADLSRYTATEGVEPLERDVEGRARVLGLFYLPPYTRIVLDNSLVNNPALAQEVFLAEGAHAVDYHYLDNEMRLAVWNALHGEDLPADAWINDSGDLNHGHSWFDGPGGYDTWAGEAFMALFTQAFAPSIPVTIELAHGVTDPAEIGRVRETLAPVPEPAPTPVPEPGQGTSQADTDLREALERFIKTKSEPKYLRDAAEAWMHQP